jgi:Acyl-CoA dehydrogenase, C-terminal domain
MDASDRALLAKTVRDAIAGVAAAGEGTAAVDAALADLGWHDMLDAEPDVAVDIVFGALGATNGTATALDDVMVRALGMRSPVGIAMLLPQLATCDPPGRIDGDHVHARGLAGPRSTTADDLLVVCDGGAELRVVTVRMAVVDVTIVRGIDPDAGFHALHVGAPAIVASTLDRGAWETAVAFARRALAHQIAGATCAMLELARVHALERVQFGRPIARFQAVRHRLADALVAIEALEATLAAAAAEPTPDAAALAKAVAGRTARTVAAHCQQVLAGIGFTTDHPFHGYLKRTMVLDGLFGSADDIVVDVGRRLLATRTVPTLVEL